MRTPVCRRLVAVGALVVAVLSLSACGGECRPLPCPLPVAVRIAVTASDTNAPIAVAQVQFDGVMSGTMTCSAESDAGVCVILGPPGTYHLSVSAPGYEAVQRTVTVADDAPDCGCATGPMAQVAVPLTPAP